LRAKSAIRYLSQETKILTEKIKKLWEIKIDLGEITGMAMTTNRGGKLPEWERMRMSGEFQTLQETGVLKEGKRELTPNNCKLTRHLLRAPAITNLLTNVIINNIIQSINLITTLIIEI
jgi:hypothetical protein